MSKQIISEEFRRMQKLAGLINENIDDKELINKIENLEDKDLNYSKTPDNGLSIGNWDDVDEDLLLTQILNLIKKVNPNADLEKKKQELSLMGNNTLANLNNKLVSASWKSFSVARGLKDYFKDNLEMFK